MMMKTKLLVVNVLALFTVACSSQAIVKSTKNTHFERDPNCKVNENIARYQIPPTPNNMSLPAFGQGIIGWGTGPDGAEARLNNVAQKDIPSFVEKGVTLPMVKQWQAFYENEVRRNPCNPTAPYRAELMKKIAELWIVYKK